MVVTVYYSLFSSKSRNPKTRVCILDNTNKVVLFQYIFGHLIKKKLGKRFVKKLVEFGKVKGDWRLLYIDLGISDDTIYEKDYEID